MDQYNSLANALQSEVLSEMAGTFFGARKALEEQQEDLLHQVELLRARSAKVFSRVFFLRFLLLGASGEAEFFAALGLPPQFPDAPAQSGLRSWRPDSLPFALLPSTRYIKTVLLAYEELRRACEAYLVGEYEDDPEVKGRKRLSVNYAKVEELCRGLNARMAKLNNDMAPSSVLQYARNISTVEQPGQGSITNALGAESLDKGLNFDPVDFASLKVWKAPSLPALAKCEDRLRTMLGAFYAAHTEGVRRVLCDLKS